MNYNFFKKHVFVTTVVSVIVCFVISVAIGQLFGQYFLMGAGVDLKTIAGSFSASSIGKIIAIGCTFALLFLSKLIYDIKTERVHMGKEGRIVFLILVAVALYNVISDGIINSDVAYSEFHIGALIACALYAFVTAVLEELVCRVLLFQNMCQKWKDRDNGILLAVIVSSVVFGACHLLNISAGVNATLFQVYYAIVAGILFAVLYLLSRNIRLCILSHFLIDFGGSVGYACMPNNSAMELSGSLSPIDTGTICAVVVMTIGAVYALLLLRKKNVPAL